MTAMPCRQLSPQRPNLALLQTSEQSPPLRAKPTFDAAFLERRLSQHREQMAQLTADLATGIILEVAIALEEAEL